MSKETNERITELKDELAQLEADVKDEKGGGKGKVLALLLAGAGALGFFLKKKRERELDEALWEEPRSL